MHVGSVVPASWNCELNTVLFRCNLDVFQTIFNEIVIVL